MFAIKSNDKKLIKASQLYTIYEGTPTEVEEVLASHLDEQGVVDFVKKMYYQHLKDCEANNEAPIPFEINNFEDAKDAIKEVFGFTYLKPESIDASKKVEAGNADPATEMYNINNLLGMIKDQQEAILKMIPEKVTHKHQNHDVEKLAPIVAKLEKISNSYGNLKLYLEKL